MRRDQERKFLLKERKIFPILFYAPSLGLILLIAWKLSDQIRIGRSGNETCTK
jgi:hypothetical protein